MLWQITKHYDIIIFITSNVFVMVLNDITNIIINNIIITCGVLDP